ncbi:Unannotated, partial [Lentimonas sp. CC4]
GEAVLTCVLGVWNGCGSVVEMASPVR